MTWWTVSFMIETFFSTATCRITLDSNALIFTRLLRYYVKGFEEFSKEAYKFPFLTFKNIFEFKFVVRHIVLDTCF